MKRTWAALATLTLLATAATPTVSADFKDFVEKMKQKNQQNRQQQQQQQQQGSANQPANTQRSGSAGAQNLPRARTSNAKVTQERLGETSAMRGSGAYLVSPDARSIAFVVRQGSRLAVSVNGKVGPILDEVSMSAFQFSPDSKHHAYIGRKSSKLYLFVDHKPVTEMDRRTNVSLQGFQFAKTGGSYIYTTAGYGTANVLAKGKLYQGATNPVMSDDGKHFAFVVVDQQQRSSTVFLDGRKVGPGGYPKFTAGGRLVYFSDDARVVVGSKKGPQFARGGIHSGRLTMSPKGNRVAYVAQVPRKDPNNFREMPKVQVFVDFKPDPPVNKVVRELTFNHDGTKYTYTANNGGGDFIVVNGKPISMEYQSLSYTANVEFGPGPSHVYAVARHGGASFFLFDGKELGPFNYVRDLAVSPNGNSYAFINDPQDQRRVVELVVDGRKYDPVHKVMHLGYAPDNRLHYYMVNQQSADLMKRGLEPMTLIIGDKAIPVQIISTPPVFSADGKHMAYLDKTSPNDHQSLHYVVDGRRYPPASQFQHATFSPNGKHFLYIASPPPGQSNQRGYQLYIDGAAAGPTFTMQNRLGLPGQLPPGTRQPDNPPVFTFPNEDTVQLFATEGNTVYRLTAAMK